MPDISVLSKRELEILELIGKGRLNKQIAFDLGLSPRTVEAHVANIKNKLGLTNMKTRFVLYAWWQKNKPGVDVASAPPGYELHYSGA